MKLFYSPTSPFVRKVRLAADALGLTDRIELVTTDAFASKRELLAVNPLSKIPALVTDDGTALFDSPVICEYLDAQVDGISLFPEGAGRWRALRTQALADGMMDATVLTRLESLRPEAQRSEAFVARQTAAVGRGLELLDAEVPEGFDIGAIAVGCALGYLDLRLASLDWRASHPALAAWFADVSERPAMKTTAPA